MKGLFSIGPRLFASLFLLFAILFAASAQEIYTPYIYDKDAPAAELSAVPEGFTPFYISHFGRHGSRYHLSKEASQAYNLMRKAVAGRILSREGSELYHDVSFLHSLHDGKAGTLSHLGALEHQGIGHRMGIRFPQVFASGGKVVARSSSVGRCKTSMLNLTSALALLYPDLEISKSSNIFLYNLFSRGADRTKARKKADAAERDSLLNLHFSADRLVEAIYQTDESLPAKVSPLELCRSLYAYSAIAGCLEMEPEFLEKYFTDEELDALSQDSDFYYSRKLFPQSLEAAQPAARLLKDFISRADAVIAGEDKQVLDLRFGHDSGFVPICTLMGLEGFEPWEGETLPVCKAVPMGANIQLVFYKNSQNEVITKILHNEKEIKITNLKCFGDFTYEWKALREFWLSRIR